jgi:uncharacterized membrane protein
MLAHSIRHHWQAVLGVIAVAVLIWLCLPAPLKTTIKDRWKKIAHVIGDFQARVLLTVIYSILVLPFGLAVRFFSDSMHSKKRPEKWFDHPPLPNTLEEARRQG